MLKKILTLLTKKEQKQIFFLFLLFIASTFVEALSISSVPIFVISLTDSGRLLTLIPDFFDFGLIGGVNENRLILYISVSILIIFILKNIFISFVNYFNLNLIKKIRTKISNDLFSYYLKNDYEFHISRNPAGLIRNITSETGHCVSLITNSILFLKEILVAAAILSLLIFVDVSISLLIFIILGFFSTVFFMYTRKGSKFRGKVIQEFWGKQIQTLNHGLGSIKENKILNKENFIIDIFKDNVSIIEKHNFIQKFLVTLPRLFFEIAAILVIVIISFSFVYSGRPVIDMLPLLSLVTVCAVRMIPSFNTISSSYLAIRHYLPSLDIIIEQFNNSKEFLRKNNLSPSEIIEDSNNFKIPFQNEIQIKNLTYTYPGSKKKIIDDASFDIKKNDIVGIVGPSGIGKSTLIDLISGLLRPNNGEILVDGLNINENVKSWQKQIGYVPQEVYLLDDSIKANVAFGVRESEFDDKLFKNSLKLAQIEEFVLSLPDKEMTKVGDRGVRISGGQKQRIGIARAIYFSPTVLIFDEPTSALDKENEKRIISDLYKLSSKNSIIIVTHKLSILENCNKIFEIGEGKIFEKSFNDFY